MKITTTLSVYLVKRYLVNLTILIFALLSVIYLFDTVELIRRASKHENVPISLVLQMGLLKLAEVGQTLFPFAILFSAMFTFWQLTRKYELIVVRASGFSVWQFLLPIIATAVVVGILQMTIINPIGAALIGKFEHLERTYLSRQENQVAVFKEGLWLRQAVLIESDNDASPSANLSSGYVILHAQKVNQPGWELQHVMALFFDQNNNFLQRIDAPSATLEKGNWLLKDSVLHQNHRPPTKENLYKLPTNLTIRDIEESFSSPQSMSFWSLPAYIQTLEKTGFDASKLKVHYQNLLSQPLMFAAMILLAATVSMRPPRSKNTFTMILLGVFAGFIIFFLSNFLQALGSSQQIPVSLAAWSPSLICFLLGLSVMMSLEDG